MLSAITARPVANIGDENVGCAPAYSNRGALPMATPNEHRLSQEGCRISAELALNEELRQAWLNIADSYGLLLMMDKI